MAIIFLSANSQTNAIVGANQFIPVYTDHNVFTITVDDTDNGIKDLLQNVNAHKLSDIMVGIPYIAVYYDGTNVVGTLTNTTNTSTQAYISILGTAFQVAITNGQFTFPIKIHPSVMNQRIPVAIRISDFPYTYLEVGGANGDVPVQIYKDNSDTYNIVPLKNIDLANYWQNSLVDMQWGQADLATITGLLAHTLFNYVLPNMNLTLTVGEQNGLNDIRTNVLPIIPTTLANMNPDNVNVDIHYNSYKLHIAQAKQAMDKYVADIVEIEKYTTFQ